MYKLEVYYPGDVTPQASMTTNRAPEALALIGSLLGQHGDCDRLVVSMSGTRLFAVDRFGAELPEKDD